MRHTTLALIALAAAGFASSAVAADLSGPMVPPMMPAMEAATYDWSGAYFGGQIGYGWSHTAVDDVHMFDDSAGTTESSFSPIPAFSFDGAGVVGGAEAGMNWQGGGVVLGLEADISAANISGTYTDNSALFSVDSNINWLSTARVRIGLPVDRFLLFASGGLAVGGVNATLHDVYGPTTLDTSDSNTSIGWTVGGGVAAAIDNHWSIKAEYLYVDLGSKAYTFEEDPSGATGFPLITTNAKATGSIIRAAIDYKF